MLILAVNAGSTSLKFAVREIAATTDRELLRGAIDRIGMAGGTLRVQPSRGDASIREADAPDHGDALELALSALDGAGIAVEAVGHRVVHGGALTQPSLIDDRVLDAVERARSLAPLHNGPSLAGIKGARSRLPDTPAVAVFDTAFHATIPDAAATYALPIEVTERYGIRRYGFHGVAHQSMVERFAEVGETPLDQVNIITLQLGGGASACAVRGGRSIDTSMGFTPSEGLVMGTRSGDIDPSIVTFLQREAGMSIDDVDELLNRRSGLAGMAGTSNTQELLAAEAAGDDLARIALDVYCYRVRKYIGAYTAVVPGALAVVFGGAVGERSPEIRRRICEPLDAFGIRLDSGANEAADGSGDARIDKNSGMAVWVLPVDEQRIIARETFRALTHDGG